MVLTRRIAVPALKCALGLGLLSYVIARNWRPAGGGPGLADALDRPLEVVPFAVAGLFTAFSALVTFVRWYLLVRAQDLPFTLTSALRLGMVGYFFNTLLPGSVGGDLVKAVGIARGQQRRTVAVATVLIDRAIGLWALVWLVALLGGAFWLADDPVLHENAGLWAIVRLSWIVAAVSTAVWALLGVLPEWRAQRFARRLTRLPRIGHSAAEFWRAVWLYRLRGGAIAVALALSLVSHVGNVLTFHFASRSLVGADEAELLPTLTEHFLIAPVGMAVEGLFPAPGGVGGGEAGYGMLYVLARGPAAEALGVRASLVQRSLKWILGAIGYLVYLRLKPSLPAPAQAHHPADEPAPAAPP
jgi:glycosyltransferase 2 family protein